MVACSSLLGFSVCSNAALIAAEPGGGSLGRKGCRAVFAGGGALSVDQGTVLSCVGCLELLGTNQAAVIAAFRTPTEGVIPLLASCFSAGTVALLVAVDLLQDNGDELVAAIRARTHQP